MPRKAPEPETEHYERATPEIEQPEEDLIPVISRRVSNYWLTYYDDSVVRPERVADQKIVARGTRKVLILPGLNYKSRAELLACGISRASNVKLDTRQPTELYIEDALELIKMTTNRDALRRWRSAEERKDVIKALDARLHGARAA